MKKIYILLSICFVVVSCGGGVASKSSISEEVIDSSRLFVVDLLSSGMEQAKFDTIKLGRIKEGESFESHFFVKNTSTVPMVVSNIVTGCGCTSVKYDTKPLQAGSQSLVTLTYDSKGQYGVQMKKIDIITSDYGVSSLYLSCTVVDK